MTPTLKAETARAKDIPTMENTIANHCCSICMDSPSDPVKLRGCGHTGCQECFVDWIVSCEKKGKDEATCPTCRCKMDPSQVPTILGRAFQRVSQAPSSTEDEFTMSWLQDQQACKCEECGIWIVYEEPAKDEEEEGDEKKKTAAVTCMVCGYSFCWGCRNEETFCECECEEGEEEEDNS